MQLSFKDFFWENGRNTSLCYKLVLEKGRKKSKRREQWKKVILYFPSASVSYTLPSHTKAIV